jgi:signal peptidase I
MLGVAEFGRRGWIIAVSVLAATGCDGFATLDSKSIPTAEPLAVVMDGNSMEPTIRAGATVTVNPGADIRRGDVVLLNRPDNRRWIRRVVALSGETLRIDGSPQPPVVSVAEVGSGPQYAFDEVYIAPSWTSQTMCCTSQGLTSATAAKFTVPADRLYVLGDNRDIADDSRTVGPVARGDVVGRVVGDPRLPTTSPPEPWIHDGSTVPASVIQASGGPSHCGLQSVTFLWVTGPLGASPNGAKRSYARDPGDVLRTFGHLQGTLDLHAQLPTDAHDTGYHAGSIKLFYSPTDQDRFAYLVGPDGVERWPRDEPPTLCA